MGQNVSTTLRVEAYLMTVNVRYNATRGSSRSEFCITGEWHADFGIADIVERVRDLDDDPYHTLHCLIMKLGTLSDYVKYLTVSLYNRPG